MKTSRDGKLPLAIRDQAIELTKEIALVMATPSLEEKACIDELALCLDKQIAEHILDLDEDEFFNFTGFSHESQEGVLLMEATAIRCGSVAVARKFELADEHMRVPESQKLLRRLKSLEKDFDRGGLPIHVYTILNRIEQIESRLAKLEGVPSPKPRWPLR